MITKEAPDDGKTVWRSVFRCGENALTPDYGCNEISAYLLVFQVIMTLRAIQWAIFSHIVSEFLIKYV